MTLLFKHQTETAILLLKVKRLYSSSIHCLEFMQLRILIRLIDTYLVLKITQIDAPPGWLHRLRRRYCSTASFAGSSPNRGGRLVADARDQ